MSPTGPERHHSYCPPDQTETERKLLLKRWKWSGVESTDREKHPVAGKGKPCCHAVLSPMRFSVSVCAGERNRGWCVAGQCSLRCLKSIADQDKLSHSNKLHIPALIWPKYLLDNINI